jgi:hypothetical protein
MEDMMAWQKLRRVEEAALNSNSEEPWSLLEKREGHLNLPITMYFKVVQMPERLRCKNGSSSCFDENALHWSMGGLLSRLQRKGGLLNSIGHVRL